MAENPSKFNPISILVIGGLIFGIYAAVKFGPAYWTQWQVKEVLRDACSQLYQFRRYHQTDKVQTLQTTVHQSIEKLGIDDPEATIEFPDDDPNYVVARATYTIVIKHPVGKPSVLHFSPESRMSSTPVDWDKKK